MCELDHISTFFWVRQLDCCAPGDAHGHKVILQLQRMADNMGKPDRGGASVAGLNPHDDHDPAQIRGLAGCLGNCLNRMKSVAPVDHL